MSVFWYFQIFVVSWHLSLCLMTLGPSNSQQKLLLLFADIALYHEGINILFRYHSSIYISQRKKALFNVFWMEGVPSPTLKFSAGPCSPWVNQTGFDSLAIETQHHTTSLVFHFMCFLNKVFLLAVSQPKILSTPVYSLHVLMFFIINNEQAVSV